MATNDREQTATLSFTNGGNNFIYEDCPEQFQFYSSNLLYMWGASVGTSYKDVEMYHHLNWSQYSGGTIWGGVAVYNSTNSPMTVTYRFACHSEDEISGSTGRLYATANVLKAFFNGTAATYNVPARSVVVLPGVVTQHTANKTKFIYFRGQLKASISSGAYVRVYLAGNNMINSIASQLFEIKEPYRLIDSQLDKMAGFFCGEVSYTQKIATLTTDMLNETYLIFRHLKGVENPNEYGKPMTHKEFGSEDFAGNFGVQYRFNLPAASGKTMVVEPDWTNVSRHGRASIVYRQNNGSWVNGGEITTGGWRFNLSGSPSTVDLALPGGNCGNYWVYFE